MLSARRGGDGGASAQCGDGVRWGEALLSYRRDERASYRDSCQSTLRSMDALLSMMSVMTSDASLLALTLAA